MIFLHHPPIQFHMEHPVPSPFFYILNRPVFEQIYLCQERTTMRKTIEKSQFTNLLLVEHNCI